MSFMVNICFPSGSLEFGDVQGNVCLHDQCPIKTLALSLTRFLFLHLVAGVIDPVLCISTGRGLFEACVYFPPVFAPCLFSLCLFCFGGLPRWLSGKESACWCRRHRSCGFHPWVGRSPGGRHVNTLQYSCLGNLMDKALQATVHRIKKSWTWLSDWVHILLWILPLLWITATGQL